MHTSNAQINISQLNSSLISNMMPCSIANDKQTKNTIRDIKTSINSSNNTNINLT